LNAYGESFSGFLERFAPAATLPYLPDVARLEWAVNRALHADEAPAVELTELASIGESDQARLTLVAHPSVSAVSSGYPVDAIWRAVLDGDDRAIAALDLSDGPCHLLVERVGDHVEVSRMDAAAWEFSRALFMGVPLGLAVERHGDLDVAAWLAAHLVAHRFTSWSLTDGTER
jgi:hypothetical protein